MKAKIFNILIISITTFVLIELLIEKDLIRGSIIWALNIWVNNLIPSLLSFFIISDILINYNIITYIPRKICNFCKHLFNISDNMLTILILSMISGFPSNARNTRTLYDKEMISLEEANHILIFSHFANPVFIITTIGIFFFHNSKIGLIILISHYLSNIILGIVFRRTNEFTNHQKLAFKKSLGFGIIFINAIKKAIDTILLICGIVVVFLTLSEIIINLLNFNLYNTMIIKGLFEITIGIEALSSIDISNMAKAIIASMILAFGGISVHVQVYSQIADSKIEYGYFLMGRMWQMVISGILTFIFSIIFKI